MEILSGRILLRPADLGRSQQFYGDALGLAVTGNWAADVSQRRVLPRPGLAGDLGALRWRQAEGTGVAPHDPLGRERPYEAGRQMARQFMERQTAAGVRPRRSRPRTTTSPAGGARWRTTPPTRRSGSAATPS